MNSITSPAIKTEINPANKQIISKLQDTFGKNIIKGISEVIDETKILGLKRVNKALGKYFVSSCFHPDEFGIGAYRVTSIFNTLELAEALQIEPEIEYFDSLNSGGIRGFPNQKLGKNKPTVINEIKKTTEKKESPKSYFKLSDKIFENLIQSSIGKESIDKETIIYIENIFKSLEIYSEIQAFLEEKGYDQKKRNDFFVFLLQDQIIEVLQDIKKIFTKKLLQKSRENISITEIYAELQNAILELLFSNYFGEYREKLESIGLMNKTGFHMDISYNSGKSDKYKYAIESILDDPNLGEELFYSYFTNLLEKSGGKPVKIYTFGETGKDYSMYIYKENGDITFYKKEKKNYEKIESEIVFQTLTNKDSKINLSGAMSIFLSSLGGMFHIGSERGLREVTAKTMEQHFQKKGLTGEKYKKYIEKVINNLGIFDTFEEGKDNSQKKLAGSCGTAPDDMLQLLFIGGEFAKDQLEQAKQKNEVQTVINKKLLLKSLEKCVKGTYRKLQESDNKNNLQKFYNLSIDFRNSGDINTFLELVDFCFKISKYL